MSFSCTRNDVARRAGVSSATVSRAYNAPGKVASEKLARIRAAAATLGYQPDRHASALRRKGTGTLLLVLPMGNPDAAPAGRVYDWFVADALLNVQAVIEGTPWNLQVCGGRDPAELRRRLGRHDFDGVIFGLNTFSPALRRACGREFPPAVFCYQGTPPASAAGSDLCFVDEVAGGRAAATALVAAGRRRPGHITGARSTLGVCRDRWQGFEAGWPATAAAIVLEDGELGISGGHAAARRRLPDIRAGRLDSLFVVNDLTAVGVEHALLEAGVRIPQRVALIGYDNLPFIQSLPVPLATVDIGIGRVYRCAAERLLQRLQDPGLPGTSRQAVTPRFVPGPSLAP